MAVKTCRHASLTARGIGDPGSPLAPPRQPTPLQAAFTLGCTFNRLRFYLEQAWFLDQKALYRATRMAEQLARQMRWAVPQGSRDGCEGAVRDGLTRLLDQITSDEHKLRLSDDLADQTHPGRSRGDVRRAVWDLHSPVDGLGLGVWTALTPWQRPVFRLGEYLDQGVCPEGVSGEWASLLLPGDALPLANWAIGLQQRQQEIGLPAWEPPSAMSALSCRERIDQMRRLRHAVLDGLRGLPDTPRSPTVRERVRVLDPAAQMIALDGQEFNIDHKQAFTILARLIEAGGDLVPGEVLDRLPGCRGGKVDRVLREHLPPELRAIIKGRRGRSGGRWICLPLLKDPSSF